MNEHCLFRKNHRGVGLIYVIAITSIVALVVSLMTAQYLLHQKSIRNTISKTQAYYTAEAGIKKALNYLLKDEKKGIEWRTGDLISDSPIREKVFCNREDEAEISILDDCGYLRIKSKAGTRWKEYLDILVAGTLPDDMKNTLCLVSTKPLVITSGSQIKGRVKLNQEPLFRGGSLDGILETNSSLSLPPLLTRPFAGSISYFRYLLSAPTVFDKELFSTQAFSPDNPVPARKIFVNDAVLIENPSLDSVWQAGNDLIIASTAEVQVSGCTRLSNVLVIAVGPVKILDRADIRSARIYSETAIELREETRFSGILIAPEIVIKEKTRLSGHSVIYCGTPLKSGTVIIDTEVPGTCTVINTCSDQGKKDRIEITNRTKMEGFVYSLAPLTHRGEITGSVYCRGFYDKPLADDTTNTNIISGTIKPADSLATTYIPVVFTGIKDFRIIEWQEF